MAAHLPLDPAAVCAVHLGCEIGMNAWDAVAAMTVAMSPPDVLHQFSIGRRIGSFRGREREA